MILSQVEDTWKFLRFSGMHNFIVIFFVTLSAFDSIRKTQKESKASDIELTLSICS